MRNRYTASFARVVLVMALSPMAFTPAVAREIFVAPGAPEDGAGTREAPMSVFAAAEAARAGDVVILGGGVYMLDRPVVPRHSGTAEAPITWRNAEGEHPILDGLGFVRTEDGQYPSRRNFGIFHLNNLSHINVIGLHVRNARYVNFMITGDDASHIALYGCTAENSYGPGICLWRGQHLKVIGCTVTGANDQEMRVPGQRTGSEAPHEALSLMQVKHVQIAYNRVHKCHKEGIDIKETASHVRVHNNEVYDLPRQGIYVDCWFGHQQDVQIHDNVVHNCEWGIVISAEGRGASMSDVVVRHNVVYRNRASGIFFGRWGNDGPRANIDIYHNTVVDNGSPGHWAGDVGGIDVRAENLRNVRIVNNIVHGNHGFEIATFAPPDTRGEDLASRNIVIENNMTGPFRPAESPRGGMFNAPHAIDAPGTIHADPLFVMWKAADYRLRDHSPARNAARTYPGIDGGPHIGCAQNGPSPHPPQPAP